MIIEERVGSAIPQIQDERAWCAGMQIYEKGARDRSGSGGVQI